MSESIFYSRLQRVLNELGWSQATLAKNTNTAHAVISRWRNLEDGKLPQKKSLDRVVALTGARIEYLTTGQEPIFAKKYDSDIESLIMAWEGLSDNVKNKIFREAETYPYAAKAKRHGKENSKERAVWVSNCAADSVGVAKEETDVDLSNKYVAKELSESEYYWLCLEGFVNQKMGRG